MRRRGTGVVCVLVASVTLFACSRNTVSKAPFVKKANAICAEGGAQLKKILDATLGNGDSFTTQVIPATRRTLDQLKALKPPKADRARVKQMWSEGDTAFKKWAEQAKVDPMRATTDEPETFGKFAASTRSYGLRGCGT